MDITTEITDLLDRNPWTPDTVTLWVCEDCHLAAAGYDERETGRDLSKALTLLGDYGMGNLTGGLLAAEHDGDCPNVDEDEWVGGEDCQCERTDFSKLPCDGCGDADHGPREAWTWWSA